MRFIVQINFTIDWNDLNQRYWKGDSFKMRKRWSKCKISISKNLSLSIGSYLVSICIKRLLWLQKRQILIQSYLEQFIQRLKKVNYFLWQKLEFNSNYVQLTNTSIYSWGSRRSCTTSDGKILNQFHNQKTFLFIWLLNIFLGGHTFWRPSRKSNGRRC